MKLFALPPLLVMAITFYVGLEHLGLYLTRRGSRSHLTFACTAMLTAAYCGFAAARYDAASMDSSIAWVRAQAVTTLLLCPALLLFVYDVVGRKGKRVPLIVGLVFGSLTAIELFTDWLISDTRSFVRNFPSLGLTYYDTRPGILMQVVFGCVIAVLGYSFLLILQHYRKRDHSVRPILVSAALYFLTILSDIAVNVGLLHLPYLSEFGILFLIVGMDRSLHNDLAVTSQGLVESERRYRSLVEDSKDIVFVLRPDGTIETINRAVTVVLGHRPRDLEGSSLADLLHQPVGTPESLTLIHFQEQLDSVVRDRVTAEFKSELINRRREPVELSIRLEPIERGAGFVIHGKASMAVEDVLGKYCQDEEQNYTIPNNLAVTELLIRRLTDGVARRATAEELADVRIGLQEILINAVEHGNLDISFNEKAAAMETGRLSDLVRSRRDDPRFSNRRVQVHYQLRGNEVRYRVTDDGIGFDHRKMLRRDVTTNADARRLHGRGLALALAMFDEVTFNEAGNSVSLRKRLSWPTPQS